MFNLIIVENNTRESAIKTLRDLLILAWGGSELCGQSKIQNRSGKFIDRGLWAKLKSRRQRIWYSLLMLFLLKQTWPHC